MYSLKKEISSNSKVIHLHQLPQHCGTMVKEQVGIKLTQQNQYTSSDAGFYFALQERPGQMRFGADEIDAESFQYWNDLSWETLNNLSMLDINLGISPPTNNNEGLTWGQSSADMASILAQQPVLFLVHSTNLII